MDYNINYNCKQEAQFGNSCKNVIENPFVSVIVPVYNVQKYLVKCLDSLINQTLKNIEIICINDGSTDKSLDILQKYAQIDNRIIIINKENEGQAVARNVGIDISKGEYLGFVDSDDWVDADYFEKLYNAAKENNCDIACAGSKRYKKNRISIQKKFDKEEIFSETNSKIKICNVPSHNYVWNKIYLKQAWLKHNLSFSKGKYYEDMSLTIKILYYMDKIVTVPNTYYNYRFNTSSTVSQKTSKHANDYRLAVRELYDFAEKNNIEIDKSNIIEKKVYYKIFNITLLKIYYYNNRTKYNLFGFIPIMTKITF